jgi:hypothetical protein
VQLPAADAEALEAVSSAAEDDDFETEDEEEFDDQLTTAQALGIAVDDEEQQAEQVLQVPCTVTPLMSSGRGLVSKGPPVQLTLSSQQPTPLGKSSSSGWSALNINEAHVELRLGE